MSVLDGLIGAGLGAAATALVGWFGGWWAFRAGQRQIEAEHVIAERAKWRDKLRVAMDDLVRTEDERAARRVATMLELNTSPVDPEDVALVALARSIRFPRDQIAEVERLVTRVSILLKHDWERSKREACLAKGEFRRIPFDRLEDFRRAARDKPERYWSGQRPSLGH